MSGASSPEIAFGLATTLHAGFQVTVTALVYPVLVRTSPEQWDQRHAWHSQRITPLVGGVYAALVGSGLWLAASGPGPLEVVAVALAAASVGITALAAAPLHGRLSDPEPARLSRLSMIDRWRCATAVAAAVAAAWAVLGGAA